MTQACNDSSGCCGPAAPATPAEAAACCGPIDEFLNVEFFRVLGDPTRAGLLACLAKCRRPCSVSELAACCAVDISVVSRHMAMLARAGMVEATKEGRTVSYRVCYSACAQALRNLADAIDELAPRAAEAPR